MKSLRRRFPAFPSLVPFSLLVLLVASLQGALPAGRALADTAVTQGGATLGDASGAPIGMVSFTQAGSQVRVTVIARGLTPGWHGFHVHEVGSCVAPTFASAGGHLGAALGQKHADHKGDMTSLLVQADGTVRSTFRTDHFSISDLFQPGGTAVIIHAGSDNFANIPLGTANDQYTANTPSATALTAATGNAGARVACGVLGAATAPLLAGYLMAAADGGVFSFGDANFQGSLGGKKLNSPVVAMAPAGEGGYYLGAADGGVFAFGDATFQGSLGGKKLNSPVVGMATAPQPARAELIDTTGKTIGSATFAPMGGPSGSVVVVVEARGLPPGWHGFHVHEVGSCVAPDFTSAGGHLGAAQGQIQPDHKGDLPSLFVNADGTARASFRTDRLHVPDLFQPGGAAVIVHAQADNFNNIPLGAAPDQYVANSPTATAVTGATGNAGRRIACGVVKPASSSGYWLSAGDGGVFSFGDAQFFGSMGGKKLNKPVAGLAATPSGNGYYLVASDGGIFTFGDARFFGSMGGTRLNSPIVAVAATRSGQGYWLTAADGGVFSFGDAPFFGSMGGTRLNSPVVSLAPSQVLDGYRLIAADGGVFSFGEPPFVGGLGGTRLNAKVVAGAGPH